MGSKKIYLIRHGETDFNRRGVVQGSGIDSSLNDTGRDQASAFHAVYGDHPFDHVYTSALVRSQQSVAGFIDRGLSHTILPGLNEIHWGEKEGKTANKEDRREYFDIINKWREGHTHIPIEGGESPKEVQVRQLDALNHILSNEDEKEILICMHGRAMRIFLCLMLNYPLQNMDIFDHKNLALYRLNYTGSVFNMELYNNVAHLDV